MSTCSGCKQQELLLDEQLCLSCVEQLGEWLRMIPVLFGELDDVRLPGSVRQSGPYAKTSSIGSAAPVRLAVVDLLDRGEVLTRLQQAWPGGEWFTTVTNACLWYRQHLLSLVAELEIPGLYRVVRGLVRDLGRVVGEPEEMPVGKCSQPIGSDGELCRGQLFRREAGGVLCRRCGDLPEMRTQAVWCTVQHAAMVTGRPVKTIRTWARRYSPLRVWCPPMAPGLVFLPHVVELAERVATTLPHGSDSLSPGSGAEPSPETTDVGSSPVADSGSSGSGSDADVLGSVGQGGRSVSKPGNVTPPDGASSGKAVAPDPTDRESLTGGDPGPGGPRMVQGFDKAGDESRPAGSPVDGSIPSQDSPPC